MSNLLEDPCTNDDLNHGDIGFMIAATTFVML